VTVATIAVQDERVRGSADHMHRVFETMEEALEWVERLQNALGDLRATVEEWAERAWYCIECGFKTR
jgi:hypothetical protein